MKRILVLAVTLSILLTSFSVAFARVDVDPATDEPTVQDVVRFEDVIRETPYSVSIVQPRFLRC